MKSTIYKNIISNLAEGIILAEPVLDKNQEIQDFCVVYSNNEANRLLKDFSEKEMYFSYSSKTSLKDNFVEIGKEVFQNKEKIEKQYYSEKFKKWFKISFAAADDETLVLTVHDISRFIENENLLKEQNLMLGSVSDELFLSKQNLKAKLEKIESLNKELEHIAYFDKLTEIPNRAKMMMDLQILIDEAFEKNEKV